MKKTYCLSCKFFKLENTQKGWCRVEKRGDREEYPQVSRDDSCPQWTDSGQQYFIRRGWIKAQEKQTPGIS